MATVLPTRLHLILPRIKARLLQVLAFPEERVLIGTDEQQNDPHPSGAAQFVRMWASGGNYNEGYWQGMERICTVYSRKVRVTLYTQLNVDPVYHDEKWAVDPAVGHYAREHLLFEALLAFFPVDEKGNQLTTEGLIPGFVSEAEKTRRANLGMNGWGRSKLEVDVKYILDLNINLNNLNS